MVLHKWLELIYGSLDAPCCLGNIWGRLACSCSDKRRHKKTVKIFIEETIKVKLTSQDLLVTVDDLTDVSMLRHHSSYNHWMSWPRCDYSQATLIWLEYKVAKKQDPLTKTLFITMYSKNNRNI